MDEALWRHNARTASAVNLGIVFINTCYVLATMSTGSNRKLLLAINAVALVAMSLTVAFVPGERVASSRYRTLIFTLWILGGAALITVASGLDGGLSSPLTWLFCLMIVLAAIDHRPALVIVSGAASCCGYLVVVLVTAHPEMAAVGTQLAYLVAATYAAAVTCAWRWRDHDAQSQLTEQLRALADRDGLTQLYNHRSFHDFLSRAIANAARQEVSIGLLVIDLDHFKEINDREGHPCGDEVLRNVALVIREAVRTEDICARVGGEEFAVILSHVTVVAARATAERIRAQIAELNDPVAITASVGVALLSPTDWVSPSELYDLADSALYQAKRSGRNRVFHQHAA